MTKSQQPKRWLEGADEWRDVAARLSRDAQAEPDRDQRARMWAVLASQVAVEEVPVDEPTSAPVSGKSSLLKFGALLAIMGALGGVWATRSARDEVPRLPAAQESERPSVSASAPVPAADISPRQAAAPTEQPLELRTKLQNARPSRAPQAQVAARAEAGGGAREQDEERVQVTSAQQVRGSDPAAELALLVRARRVLLATPARTLELTEEHARDYPHGAFAEEREVLAIEAMVRAGQKEQAAERTKRFTRSFPRSTHTAHLEELVQ